MNPSAFAELIVGACTFVCKNAIPNMLSHTASLSEPFHMIVHYVFLSLMMAITVGVKAGFNTATTIDHIF